MHQLHWQIAQALLQIDAVAFSPLKPVTFASGLISPVYIDNRCLSYHPQQWQIVIEGFQSLINQQQLQFDVIAGIAVGGVPHSAALSYLMQCPSVFIRKQSKGHGKKKLVEGGDITNKHVLLIEDLVTTGGSCLAGIQTIRKEHAIVTDAIAIVSFGFQEASTAFSHTGITLHTLTNFTTIIDLAVESEKFSEHEAMIIHDWFNEPMGWAKRHDHV